MKHAEKEAKAIKRERDQSSQSKLEEGERPPKRPKTSQQRYDIDQLRIETCITSQCPLETRAETKTSTPKRDTPGEIVLSGSKSSRRSYRHRHMNRRMYNLNKTLNTKSLCKKHMHDNVVNVSSYTPTQTELDILSKGLSFIP